MNNTKETIGHIIKEETISLLNHHIINNTIVINVDHPFPGLHGESDDFTTHPASVIIGTDKLYSWAKILRAQKNINKNNNFDILASFAKLKVGKNIYYGIRIKGLTSYHQIPKLQQLFADNGFILLKNKKIKTDKPVSIKISKYFHIELMDNGIFKDVANEDMYYIVINDYVGWECFSKVTKQVKNNVRNNNFDVAKGLFYMDDCVTDMIRVYKPKMELKLLQEIKDQYNKLFSKNRH